MNRKKLPMVGDPAPEFEVEMPEGLVRFPQYSAGCWCIIFAHPANFTSAWEMFSAFLAMKERWLNERNTKVIGLSNVSIGQNDWSKKARRYIGIYLKGPVIEDLDCKIAKVYGLASARRPLPGCNRLALVIDPEGIIRLIIRRPLMPNIESALVDIERELNRLQGQPELPAETVEPTTALEVSDAVGEEYRVKPAHFAKKKLSSN